MKKVINILVLFCFMVAPVFAARTAKQPATPVKPITPATSMAANENPYFPGRMVVKFRNDIRKALYKGEAGKPSTGMPTIDAKMSKWDVEKVESMFPAQHGPAKASGTDLSRIYILDFASGLDVKDLVMDFTADPGVEWAEPMYIYEMHATIPNDPSFNKQVFWDNMQIELAWDVSQGSKDVVIGVVDTGVDWMHEDLADNIWVNPGEDINNDGQITEADFNNIDDDGNGLVDDIRGYDFVDVPEYWDPPYADEDGYDPDNDPMDFDGHGTHVSGLVSAVTNNGVGVAGAGWGCTIMPVRVGYTPDDNGNPGHGIVGWGYQGIEYAVRNGANIINLSWGGGGYSALAEEVTDFAWENNVLIFSSAGNTPSDAVTYPGGYEHVYAVGGTQAFSDLKYSDSSYGSWVDLSSPGVNIYSTYPNNNYKYLTGTSMSCPIVCGVAGLVWALHPEWDSDRVALQLIETTDNIDDVNPNYKGQLGTGRVNAYRAVTENPSSIQIDAYVVDDSQGNNDGIIDNDETINIYIDLKSLLDDVTNVSVTMSSSNEWLTISNREVSYGNISKDQIVTNSGTPFVFTTLADAPPGEKIQLQFDVVANDGEYLRANFITLIILPQYGTHNVNNVDLTLTSFGTLGYYDYADTQRDYGDGFQYPRGSGSTLYVGSLVVGTGPSNVSDCSYGNDDFTLYDWITSDGGNFKLGEGQDADQEGFAIYDDSNAENPLGIQVTQKSYAWASAPDNDYVLIEYDMKNTSGATLNNVYAGFYTDWDIDIDEANLNSVGYDEDAKLGYMWSAGSNYYGISMLYPDPSGHRAIYNPDDVYDNAFIDELKYEFMSSGFARPESNVEDDWSSMISAGPFSIAAGASQKICIAIMGGDDLQDIKQNATAAKAKADDIMTYIEEDDTAIPAVYTLSQNYPNPFNPVTTINYDLPVNANVKVEVFSILGERIATLVDRKQQAGSYQVNWDATNQNGNKVSSGVYFYRITTPEFSDVRKMVLIK